MISLPGMGQEAFFSQPFNAPVFYNPASIGLFQGLKARITYRDQWPQYYDDIKTYNFSLDLAERTVPGFGGAGLVVNSNTEGSGFIKRTTIGLALASRIKLNQFTYSHFGFTGSYVQKEIADPQGYIYSDQLDHRHGLIHDVSAVPVSGKLKTSYPDLNIGWLINYMRKTINATFGFSMHHIFKPDESFFGLESRLPQRFVVHTDIVIAQKRRKNKGFLFNPGLLWDYFNGFSSYQLGMNVSKSVLYAGIWYRNRQNKVYEPQALIVLAGLKLPLSEEGSRLILMYSYDLNIGGMKGTGGAHEVHLTFQFDRIKLLKGKSVFREDYDYPVILKNVRF
ncbi:MAG: PorP/SprF family type IX secretion system membrane protein [Bacteroidales bacterium]|nr:PorP/SprF family type IX secretion system membrane protein [Bacteroidales bacterium]